jgi:hypothetical protein
MKDLELPELSFKSIWNSDHREFKVMKNYY